MSGYFTRLVARAQAHLPTVLPQASLPFHGPAAGDALSSLLAAPAAAQDVQLVPRQPPRRPSGQRAESWAGPAAGPGQPADPPAQSQQTTIGPAAAGPVRRDPAADALSGAGAFPAAAGTADRAVRPAMSVASRAAAPEANRLPAGDSEFRLMQDAAVAPPHLLRQLPESRLEDDAVTRAQRRAGGVESDSAPNEIHVSIGRIEVSAVTAPEAARRASAGQRQPMSLEEYLARRQGRDS